MRKCILIVLHDAGGAAAIAPLIPHLQNRYECRIIAFETAAKELQSFEYQICVHVTAQEAEKYLEDYAPCFLLTGTSALGETIDRAFITAAKKKNIQTLSVLDYWLNYADRFCDSAGATLACLTDKIAVMNEDARNEMIAEGIPRGHIVITGSPRFETVRSLTNEKEKHRHAIKQQYGLDSTKPWLLFLSQPFIDYFGGTDKARQKLGYTEKDAIDCLVSAIDDKDIEVIARLHPREADSNRVLFQGISTVFIQDMAVDRLISAADLTTGMSTVALLDAYLMEKPVISIQPNQTGKDLCYLTRNDLVPKCENAKDLESYLIKAINGRSFIDFGLTDLSRMDSISRLLQLIYNMIRAVQ